VRNSANLRRPDVHPGRHDPLGITIVGGLMLSQLLTLYTTPVVYLYLDRLRLWSARHRPHLRRAESVKPA